MNYLRISDRRAALVEGSSINASLTGDEEALILPLLLGLNLYEC